MGLVGALLGGVVTAARDMRDVRAGTWSAARCSATWSRSPGHGPGHGRGYGRRRHGLPQWRPGPGHHGVVGIGTKYLYDGVVSAAREAKKTVDAPVKATNKKA
jgi:hypothetical protein